MGGSNTFFSQWHKKTETFFPKNPNLTGPEQIEPKLNKLIAFNFCSMSKNAFNWTNQKSITENMAIKIWFNAVQSRSIEPKKYIYRGSKIPIKRHLKALAWSGLPAAAPSRKWWVRVRAGLYAARSKIINWTAPFLPPKMSDPTQIIIKGMLWDNTAHYERAIILLG